jgi:nucleoid-associated protein YgaU
MAKGLYDRGFLVHYHEGDEAIYRNFQTYRASVDDIYHTIAEGETLHSIARKHYGSSSYWYLLADVNDNVDDIFSLVVNTTILIPSLLRT